MTEKTSRPGRNQACHCGSGKKYKRCCLQHDEEMDLLAMRRANDPSFLYDDFAMEEDLAEVEHQIHQERLKALREIVSLDREMRSSKLLFDQSQRERVRGLGDEELWAELTDLGAVDPKADLGPLIRANPLNSGIELISALRGLKDRPGWTFKEESQAAALIDAIWARHYPDVMTYDMFIDQMEVQFSWLNPLGLRPSKEDVLVAIEQAWQSVDLSLSEAVTLESVKQWEWRMDLNLEATIDDLVGVLESFETLPLPLLTRLDQVADKARILPAAGRLKKALGRFFGQHAPDEEE